MRGTNLRLKKLREIHARHKRTKEIQDEETIRESDLPSSDWDPAVLVEEGSTVSAAHEDDLSSVLGKNPFPGSVTGHEGGERH
jgi:hypothetical protein